VLRLGVILSVVWLLGFAGIALLGSIHGLRDQQNRYFKYCSDILDKDPNQTIRYEECLNDARGSYLRTADEYKQQIPRLLTEAFGPLLVGWTITLIGIGTARGVKWLLARRRRRHHSEDQFFSNEI